jgi:hypothetical protein
MQGATCMLRALRARGQPPHSLLLRDFASVSGAEDQRALASEKIENQKPAEPLTSMLLLLICASLGLHLRFVNRLQLICEHGGVILPLPVKIPSGLSITWWE